jgi:hypothetical protein
VNKFFEPLSLKIEGLGHVPSFKNSKMIARGRLITNPKRQEWMNRCIQSFESQLRSRFLTVVAETSTETSRPSWIASVVPLDDSMRFVSQIQITYHTVPKGKEGAIVEIERLC